MLQLPFAGGGALRGDRLLPRPFLPVLLGAGAIVADAGMLLVAIEALRDLAAAIAAPAFAVPAVVATALPVAAGRAVAAWPALALR